MSYETLNEQPLLLSGPDAALVRGILDNPSNLLDEFSEHGKVMMARPKQALWDYGWNQPVTYGQSNNPITRSGDAINRFENYAAALSRGDRNAAYAAISAEVKLDNASGNVSSVPLHLTAHEIGALAGAIEHVRNVEYKRLAEAAGVTAETARNPALGVTGRDFKVQIGAPIQHIKAICAAPGAPIQIVDVEHPAVTEAYLRNATSISAAFNAETNATEFTIPMPAAFKLVGQSIEHKAAEKAFYAPAAEIKATPVGAPAAKVLEKHVKEVAASGDIAAIGASNIGESLCNVDCGRLDKLFVGQRQEIGSTLGDVINAAYKMFPVSCAFDAKTEAKVREAIGAQQGAYLASLPTNAAGEKKSSVSYEMYVGTNFLPQVGYHTESGAKTLVSTKAASGVFDHAGAEHYAAHPVEHAVISAKMQDGTVIDTMLVPVPGGVKVIGGHMHKGKAAGRHLKGRGHTAYAEDADKKMYMGMLYN